MRATPPIAHFADVVLQTATSKALEGNQFFGLAIGFTVTAMAGAVGGLSGGALNPAVGLLGIPGLLNSTTTVSWAAMFAVYWTACPLGGALAACMFRLTNSKECGGALLGEKTPLSGK